MGTCSREIFLNRYKELGHDLSGDEETFNAIRVNTLKISDQNLTSSLNDRGVILRKIDFLDHGYEVIDTPFSLGASFEYLLGYIYLQEPAAQFPVMILDPDSEDSVLDMAAAPGGKTTQVPRSVGTELGRCLHESCPFTDSLCQCSPPSREI
jgi:16S rRNA C967 or C1407 C5-methylase (RsmB/RsmF family)